MEQAPEKSQFIAFIKCFYLKFMLGIIFVVFVISYSHDHKSVTESSVITFKAVLLAQLAILPAYWMFKLLDRISDKAKSNKGTEDRKFILKRDGLQLYLLMAVYMPIAITAMNVIVALAKSEQVDFLERLGIMAFVIVAFSSSITFAILFWTSIEACDRWLNKK